MLVCYCNKCKCEILGSHPYVGGYTEDGYRYDFCGDCWPPILSLIQKELEPKARPVGTNQISIELL
jgi:hypothetical protein